MTLRREFATQSLILAILMWTYSYFHPPGQEWHRVAGWFIGLASFLIAEYLFLTKRGGR